jgi:uncharacterized protein (DUF58 family)
VSARFDAHAVERAAAGATLRLPRVAHRGRLGEVRASSVGSSMELHDFRQYQPGDDLRHIDWNAVARTDELIVRVRQDEVSPRVEVLVDGSRSMAVSDEKAARTRELAAWVASLARRGGLEPVTLLLGTRVERLLGPGTQSAVERFEFDAADNFDQALRRAPPLQPCGLRVVISDFLFEANPEPLAEKLARGAAGLVLLQTLDAEDLDPTGGAGARLTDAESGEVLERVLTSAVLEAYQARFRRHVELWGAAAQRVRAQWVQVSAGSALDVLARRELVPLMEVGA